MPEKGNEPLKVQSKGTAPPEQPYSVLSPPHTLYLTYLLGYLTLASSLTATIYFPLISLLSTQYNVSIQAINLSITLYMVFQALAPSFWAPLSDSLGRRPVFLLTFLVYTVASLGLALNRTSYVALLLLRALQSIGGSSVMALAYGVVADIAAHADRGKILGPMLASTNLGPCIGPVVGGGAILASRDPQWSFWALLIFGASGLMLIGWTMPETLRSVVGNGAVPAKGLWRTWWDALEVFSVLRTVFSLRANQTEEQGEEEEEGKSSAEDINCGKTGVGKMVFPNPLSSLRIIFYWDTFLILWMAASPYATWYCIQTSIPLIYGRGSSYGYNDLIVGLCFLPGGAGVILGGVIAGRLMDWNYRRTAKEAGLPVERSQLDDIREFPIERARSRGSTIMLISSVAALTGYGWAVHKYIHASVPLILQFFIGAKCTVTLQMFSALLVDIFPDKSGTAAASNNITRSALSAGLVAILQPLVDTIGRAWFFTLVGAIDGIAGIVAVHLLNRWGRSWRQKRDSFES